MILKLKFRKAAAFWPGTSNTTPTQESSTTKAGNHARTAALADASGHQGISVMDWQRGGWRSTISLGVWSAGGLTEISVSVVTLSYATELF